jgi:hypothetical protein
MCMFGRAKFSKRKLDSFVYCFKKGYCVFFCTCVCVFNVCMCLWALGVCSVWVCVLMFVGVCVLMFVGVCVLMFVGVCVF